jgi:uncharacterized membrane protein YdjX (TVP38/TMEM64 family)
VREVEALHVDAIGSARRCIFLECQYFSSEAITRALERRLRERDGPEVVLLLPLEAESWLETSTMGARRERMLARLAAADDHHRLVVRAPAVRSRAGEARLIVHSKVMIVDDRLLKVGSANACNRSMSLDTECDVALEAEDEVQRAFVRVVRDGLLAEHLGRPREQVSRAVDERGSVGGMLATLDGRDGRALVPLDSGGGDRWLGELVPTDDLVDPERPVEPDQLAARLVHDHDRDEPRLRPEYRIALLVGALLALAALWRWTPWGDWLHPATIAGWIRSVRDGPGTSLVAIAACAAGALLLVPLTIMTVVCVMLFGPWPGVAVFYAGMLAGASATWGLGRLADGHLLRRLAGKRMDRIRRVLSRHGVLSMTLVRLVPLAPFGVVNAVAGNVGVPLRDFVLGTLLGVLPGTLVIAAAGSVVEAALLDSTSRIGWIVGGAVVVLVLLVLFLRSRWRAPLGSEGRRA